MAQLIWSPRSLHHLRAIRLFLEERSDINASAVVERIFQAALNLAVFPEAGRMVPEFGRRDTREILVRPYRVIYRIDGDTVVITTVIHGARRISEADLGH